MEGFIGLAIVLFFVAVFVTEFWEYILLIAPIVGLIALIIGLIWYILDQMKKAKVADEKQKQYQREEEARVLAHKKSQQDFKTELINLSNTSLKTFEALPDHLIKAESLLDQAELDFKESAFAPFWDSIERAATYLGHFDGGVVSINKDVKRYQELTKLYEDKPPRFLINADSVKGMIAGNTTTDRMKAIVRQAQRNFQFASIYEQRKTNQILIAGFTNLAQALDGMSQRISDSIDALGWQVSEMSTSLSTALETLNGQMTTSNQLAANTSESVQDIRSTFQKEAAELEKRHNLALDMLDNIQHGRRPPILGLEKHLTTVPINRNKDS